MITVWDVPARWAVLAIGLFLVAASAVHRVANRAEKKRRILARKSKDSLAIDCSNIQPIAPDFDWQQVEEAPHRPWKDGPHRVAMGIQKTSFADWVEIDKTYLDRYNYKRKLFAEHPDETLQDLPGSEEAAFEALGYLVALLPQRYPTMFRRTAVGIDNLVAGDAWDLRRNSATWQTYRPLQVMALLSTEDWFIMQVEPGEEKEEAGGPMRLRAGASCFPAGWRLRERIGASLWTIHAGRVPQYEEKLARGMDRFFERLRAEAPFVRFNYAIDVDPELFHIHPHHHLRADHVAAPVTVDQLHVRVERQVVQRLPQTGAVAFSIRTYVTPLAQVTADWERARALRTSVGSYTADLAAYKNKPLWEDVLAAHLAEVLGDDKDD